MSAMRILAADIGGTNARFAEIVIDGLSQVRVADPVIFPTWSEPIDSFDALLEHYVGQRPPGSPELEDFDALAIAIAGAVSGRRGTLPNIAWDIDLDAARPLRNAFLLNDFFAQAHAYLDPAVFARLRRVRPRSGVGPGMGTGVDQGSIAIVGAGTGLGHAALKSIRGRRVAIGSESGHCTFAFHGDEERKIEAAMLARSAKPWLSGDDVVTGSGAALLHAALTGNALSPAEALARKDGESATCAWFARFYGSTSTKTSRWACAARPFTPGWS
ncbi:MAG: glucokinase [Xanthomonadales bacterium]|nr:glucokinase [Xanthomonadales bacterium]